MKLAFLPTLTLLLVSCCLGATTVKPEVFEVNPHGHLQPTNVTNGTSEESPEFESNVCTAQEKDEGLKSCFEEKPNYVPLVARSVWNRQAWEQQAVRRNAPATLVVISDGGKACTTKRACLSNLLSERSADVSSPCDLQENFYVGEDGQVYEGRGWDFVSYWYLEGMRNHSITVKFMGHFDRRLPMERAIRAFHSTLALGVWTGKLSPNYKILTIDQVTSGQKCVGESLKDEVKTWVGWVDDSETSSMWEHHGNEEILALESRRNWNSTKSNRSFVVRDEPARVILLNNVFNRCNSSDQCASQLRALQEMQLGHFGDLLDNFYIGDDGIVYEGRGWRILPHWHVEGLWKTYISVNIFGSFQSELPSRRAISAFKALVQTGIQLKELSPDFKIHSLRLIYDDSTFLGDALKLQAEKWTPWSKEFDRMTPKERMDADLVPIMKRSSKWLKVLANPGPVTQETSFPIKFVILQDGGERCFDVNECVQIMLADNRENLVTYGDLLDSFYVGSDGIVYEGRGWDNSPPLYLKHLRQSFITVKFMGNFNVDKPNTMALQAFHSFIKLGIDIGKISPSYQIYSLRHIYNESSFLGDALSQYAEGLPQWSSEMAVDDDWERESKGLLPLVSRDDWNVPPVGSTIDLKKGGARYVFVGDVGDSCFSHEKCVVRMKEEQNRGLDLYGSLTDNFYVGEDGNVYEGLGWTGYSVDNEKDTGENAIFVRFFGAFHHTPPSKLAVAAFRRLIKYGLNTKNLSDDYSIISMRKLCNCSNGVGDALQLEMEKWESYLSGHDQNTFSGSVPYVRHLIVQREEWEPGTKLRPLGRKTGPADYVILFDEGERCFDRDQCGNIIKSSSKAGRIKNFFFAEDGRLYEGSGWGGDPLWKSSCPNCSVLAVSYLGNFSSEIPSASAIDAFEFLISWGVRVGKISPEYKLVSIGQLCGNHTREVSGDEVLGTEIKKWKHWSDEINLSLDCNMLYGRIVPPNIWGASKPIRGSMRSGKVNYIFVRDGRERCFTYQECKALMVKEHSQVQRHLGVLENFYIGDDGNVYEGRGWSRRPQYEFQPKGYSSDYSDEYDDHENSEPLASINVLFLGQYDRENPSEIAREAFKNLVVKKGIESGFLQSSFILRAVPDGTYSIDVGKKLKDTLNLLLP